MNRFGIVNLEAMACELAGGRNGDRRDPGGRGRRRDRLAGAIEQVADGSGAPVDPDRFVSDLAWALNQAVSDPHRARRFRPGWTSSGGLRILVVLDRRSDYGGVRVGPGLIHPATPLRPAKVEAMQAAVVQT